MPHRQDSIERECPYKSSSAATISHHRIGKKANNTGCEHETWAIVFTGQE